MTNPVVVLIGDPNDGNVQDEGTVKGARSATLKKFDVSYTLCALKKRLASANVPRLSA